MSKNTQIICFESNINEKIHSCINLVFQIEAEALPLVGNFRSFFIIIIFMFIEAYSGTHDVVIM